MFGYTVKILLKEKLYMIGVIKSKVNRVNKEDINDGPTVPGVVRRQSFKLNCEKVNVRITQKQISSNLCTTENEYFTHIL